MTTVTPQAFHELNRATNPLKFIHLKNHDFGEFEICYHVNDGYVLPELRSVGSSDQLLFQGFKSRTQQLNLMMVDSVFPIMMAEMAVYVLLNGPMTIADYVLKGNPSHGAYLMEHKMKRFINCLLYTNIVHLTPFNGEHDHERVFYQKRTNDEIEFYSIYEQRELGDLIYRVLMVEVDMERSMLNKGKADLALNFNLVV